MEREETYIPYKERTSKELCRDISIKTEKLFLKKDKISLLYFTVIFLVLVALDWFGKTYVNLWLGSIVVWTIVVCGFVVFKINRPEDDAKYRLGILAGALLVLMVVEWDEKIYVNWRLGAIVVGAFVLMYFVSFIINQKLISDMNLAASPKQYLPFAQRLRKWVQIRNFLGITLLIWLPYLTIYYQVDGVWKLIEWLILYVVGVCTEPSWMDNDIGDDLEELEFRLEE